jgi:hypothetical protein
MVMEEVVIQKIWVLNQDENKGNLRYFLRYSSDFVVGTNLGAI